jgi:feruloyl esterase
MILIGSNRRDVRALVTNRRLVLVALVAGVLFCAPAYAEVACEALPGAVTLSGATLTAEPVAPGAFQPQGGRAGGGRGGASPYAALPAFCRVAATLRPTPQSGIGMEVWLPSTGWNGKLQVVGNGGFAGSISYAAMATALAGGYAAASTDTGHTGPSSNTFAHEEVLVDFAHRAVHETTVAAKRAIDAFYGEAPRFSYFAGCSTGGRQALVAAQRYPDDFDGIVAGAPAVETSLQAHGQIWISRALSAASGSFSRDDLTLLHNGVLEACDAQDGARDGVLENPLACTFDPNVLVCREGSAPGSCLTPAQVAAARQVYAGASHARTGAPLFPGLERGSELGWSPTPVSYAVDVLKYRVFNDPEWTPDRLDFDAHVAEAVKPSNQILDAADPDLQRFTARGGRLLMYTGWAEPGIPPRRLVSYYEEVRSRTPGASDSVRLFMVPGMGHCGGGNGASTFDMVAALDRWVTSGTPPASIPASRVRNGEVDRTRPLCPYPSFAVYSGTGSLDDAANFRCGVR